MSLLRWKAESRAQWLRQWGSGLVMLVMVSGLIWYLASYSEEIHRVQALSLWKILALSGLILCGHLIGVGKLLLVTRLFQVRLSFWEAFSLAEAGALLNLAPVNLGTGLRAAYLKSVHNLRFTEFGLGFLALLVSTLASAGFLGLVLGLCTGKLSSFLYVVFCCYILAPACLVFFGRCWGRRTSVSMRAANPPQTWYGQVYRSLVSGSAIILSRPGFFLSCLLLDLVSSVSLGMRYWLVGFWLDYPFDFASGIILQSVSRLSSVFSFLPAGAIGFQEALTGLGATGLGQAAVSGVMISTVDRIVGVAWLLVAGSIGLFVVRSRIADAVETVVSTKSNAGRA